MNINPNYGYAIKYTESETLAEQIATYLANGGTINEVEPTYQPVKYSFNNSVIGLDKDKQRVLTREQRKREQFNFLKKVRKTVGYGAWAELADAAQVIRTHVGKVALGKGLFLKHDTWARVEAAAIEIMEKCNDQKSN